MNGINMGYLVNYTSLAMSIIRVKSSNDMVLSGELEKKEIISWIFVKGTSAENAKERAK